MGIERLLEENKKEKQESNSLKNMVASLLLEKAKADNKNCLFTDINDPVFLRFLATGGSEIFGVCAVFCMVSENNYRYVAVRSKNENLDMRTFAKEMNSALCGRGGGDFELVQGSVKAARADIEEFFKNSSK
jgi:alanyl-tRNA synthetase